jgi:hypothetical protein
MTLGEWLTALGTIGSLLLALTAIITVKTQLKHSEDAKRKDDINMGIKQQEQVTLKAEVEVVKARVGAMEERMSDTRVSIAELKTDMQHALETLVRIENKLECLGK